jgi:hypothetical protein
MSHHAVMVNANQRPIPGCRVLTMGANSSTQPLRHAERNQILLIRNFSWKLIVYCSEHGLICHLFGVWFWWFMTTWSLGLTILFEHVFVDISRSQWCKKTTCKNAKTKGQNRARKGKEKTPSDEPTVPQIQASVQSSDELVHRVKP